MSEMRFTWYSVHQPGMSMMNDTFSNAIQDSYVRQSEYRGIN